MSILKQIEAANKLLANEEVEVKDLLVTLRNEKTYVGEGRYSMDSATGFLRAEASDEKSCGLKDILIYSDEKTFSSIHKNRNHHELIRATKKLIEGGIISVNELIEHQDSSKFYKGPGYYYMAASTGVIKEMVRRPQKLGLSYIALACDGKNFKIVEISEFITNAEKEDKRLAEEKEKQAKMLRKHLTDVGNEFKEKNGNGLYACVRGTDKWIFLGKYVIRNLTKEEKAKGYVLVPYNLPKYSINRDSKKLWAVIAGVVGLLILLL